MILENEYLLLEFHEKSGGLIRLFNKQSKRELLCSNSDKCASPFVIWNDFTENYRFADYKKPMEPSCFCKNEFVPDNAEFKLSNGALEISYRLSDSLTAYVTVTLDEVSSRWQLSIKNEGNKKATLLPAFPCLDNIALPDSGRMLGVNQTGAVDKIWAYPGGVYGNAADQSCQLGCLFDDEACLGFYIEDSSFIGKEIVYRKPSVQVRWFPEKTLNPGETLTLPTAVIIAYKGSWKKTAKAYGDWFRSKFELPDVPDWLRKTLSYRGAWFEKEGKPNSSINGALGKALNSFREMPVHYTETQTDINEYAFYCKLSAAEETRDEICCGAIHWHTDGVNEIREDLGGIDALKEGVAKVHAMGKKVMLYVEGLIVPRESELFKRNPDAKNWIYNNIDGGNDGLYTQEGFVHMCCGCEEWQNHLAKTCARLVKETDVDGIRLDSFSYYHWPCYNPKHNHKNPFDSNLWMQELLRKVSSAVKEVKSDAILATEAAIDFNRLYMNMALDQYLDNDRIEYGVEDCSVFRVLFPDYYIPRINGGPVMESLQLLPDGCGELRLPENEKKRAAHWREARKWMGDIYTEGYIPDSNPTSSRKDTQCRIILSENEALIIAARINFDKIYGGESSNAGLMKDFYRSEITAELPFAPDSTEVFDIEKGEVIGFDGAISGTTVTWNTCSNWCCLLCRK